MSTAKYPFVLRERLGGDGYSSLIEMVDDHHRHRLAGIDERFEAITDRFERRLTEEFGKLRLEMNGLRTEMARQHADLMKWAMLFWVGQAAAVAGIVVVLR